MNNLKKMKKTCKLNFLNFSYFGISKKLVKNLSTFHCVFFIYLSLTSYCSFWSWHSSLKIKKKKKFLWNKSIEWGHDSPYSRGFR